MKQGKIIPPPRTLFKNRPYARLAPCTTVTYSAKILQGSLAPRALQAYVLQALHLASLRVASLQALHLARPKGTILGGTILPCFEDLRVTGGLCALKLPQFYASTLHSKPQKALTTGSLFNISLSVCFACLNFFSTVNSPSPTADMRHIYAIKKINAWAYDRVFSSVSTHTHTHTPITSPPSPRRDKQ